MKLGWQIAIVVAAVATGLYMSRKPWQVFVGQRAGLEQTKQEMREAESERERMLIEKQKLTSPIGKEERLRKEGYVKKGEKPVDN